jgi:hypothetical protein
MCKCRVCMGRDRLPWDAITFWVFWLVFGLLLALSGNARGESREPPAALPPGYDAVGQRCRDTGKAMIVWVGVAPRIVPDAIGLACATFPDVKGPGIVVGIHRGGVFERYDLPAGATDAEIAAVYGGRLAAAGPPAAVPAPVPVPVYVAPAPPRYYYGSVDCPPGGA